MNTKEQMNEAADVLDTLAAGRIPDRGALLAAALTLAHCNDTIRDMLDAAAGLEMWAKGGTLDLDPVGRERAAKLAQIVREAARLDHAQGGCAGIFRG